MAGAFSASAATVSFEADITDQSGVSGDSLSGVFEVDGSGQVLSLSLEIDGLFVTTTGAAAVNGDLSSGLTLVGSASTSTGLAGTLGVDWVAGGSGAGAATSSVPSVELRFVEFLAADIDRDGIVGGPDFVELTIAFGDGPGPADITGDGLVGGPDFVELTIAFGDKAQSFSATAAVTSTTGGSAPTPEPTSAVLFLVGTLVIRSSLRRRR